MDVIKKYGELEEHGTREEREAFLKSLPDDELDKLIKEPSSVQRKIYIAKFKRA